MIVDNKSDWWHTKKTQSDWTSDEWWRMSEMVVKWNEMVLPDRKKKRKEMSDHPHWINPLVACAISCHFLRFFCILLVIFGDNIETRDTYTNSFQSNRITAKQGFFFWLPTFPTVNIFLINLQSFLKPTSMFGLFILRSPMYCYCWSR